jgi:aminocarboxymuconate-semialdehyde decarboxylase
LAPVYRAVAEIEICRPLLTARETDGTAPGARHEEKIQGGEFVMMFTCASGGAIPHHGGSRRVSDGSKTLTVDIHCHCQVQAAAEMIKAATKDSYQPPLSYGGDALTQQVNEKQLSDIKPKMESVAVRLADMDAMGVDIQAVSPAPYQYYYWAEPEPGRAAAQAINDHLAGIAAAHPDRFVALGTVPLQHTGMAVAELERCVKKLGMRGVEISTNVKGEELSNPRLADFFAKAEELDILIFMHPAGFTQPQRFAGHYFANLIGHPLEASLAIGYLIFDGVLDRHPGLKICVAHGGGYAPAYAGRMDHGYHARPDCRQHIALPPSAYLKRLYFDTMVFEPDQLAFLIEKYGSEHILLGTDYPYDMGDYDPRGLVARVPDLSQEDRERICGGNAARLLGLG